VLVVTAVAAERDAAVRRLGPSEPRPDLPYDAVAAGNVIAAAGGVGPVAAAVAVARLLAALDRAGTPASLVVSAGIAGGFAGRARIGDAVIARNAVFADLGAATDDGFLDLAGLGLAGGAPLASPVTLDGLPTGNVLRGLVTGDVRTLDGLVTGDVLTLATMTGTDAGAAALAAAHPAAVAEAMEGYGVAWAAAEHGVPWAEVRAISNLIGRRDRSGWDIPAAFESLGAAVATVVTAC
jgi:futalosine hydrolase